jgi:hypothetical protein|tara:strand:- start:462 stop:1130 length:669 start_codon:yes stop_codon:yes gene_type:complete
VKEGDRVPEAVLQHFDSEGELRKVSTAELCGDGKTVVLFAVPGAFTPTCSLKHLPGFIKLADEMKDAGADDVVCVSVNDAFVMRAWEKSGAFGSFSSRWLVPDADPRGRTSPERRLSLLLSARRPSVSIASFRVDRSIRREPTEGKSLRISVHHADGVVWGPVSVPFVSIHHLTPFIASAPTSVASNGPSLDPQWSRRRAGVCCFSRTGAASSRARWTRSWT